MHDSLDAIYKDVLALTTPLADERRANGVLPVLGEGNHNAQIVFIGEAPGKNEAKLGRPFCGASGKFLDVMLASIGLDRSSVYITNLVNDRPTDNRDPSPEEIAEYTQILCRVLKVIRPAIVVTLGRLSMAHMLKTYAGQTTIASISEIHGTVFDGEADFGKLKILTLYHPAAALYKGSMRQVLLEDFAVLKQFA